MRVPPPNEQKISPKFPIQFHSGNIHFVALYKSEFGRVGRKKTTEIYRKKRGQKAKGKSGCAYVVTRVCMWSHVALGNNICLSFENIERCVLL